jgi:hypothetical protein
MMALDGGTMTDLTYERAAELLSYCAETGILRWKATGKPTSTSTVNAGYMRVGIDKKNYRAHRLAWLLHTGAFPVYDIDHIDGNKANNAIANLRDVPSYVNKQNRQRPNKGNALGFLGVTSNHGGFSARIYKNGQRIHIGNYSTPEEAHAVYLEHRRREYVGNTI